MKKILLIFLVITFSNCGGYKPIFSGQDVNFYISDISNLENDEISRKIIKKLNPYTEDNNKNEIKLKLNSSSNERIISKDSKGDPSVFELKIVVNIELNSKIKNDKLYYTESFTYNNQSNKFELKQYRDDIENNLVDKIFEKIIIELRSI